MVAAQVAIDELISDEAEVVAPWKKRQRNSEYQWEVVAVGLVQVEVLWGFGEE